MKHHISQESLRLYRRFSNSNMPALFSSAGAMTLAQTMSFWRFSAVMRLLRMGGPIEQPDGRWRWQKSELFEDRSDKIMTRTERRDVMLVRKLLEIEMKPEAHQQEEVSKAA